MRTANRKRKARNRQRISLNEFYGYRNDVLQRVRYTDKYDEWRRDVISEQGKRCQICGTTGNIQVHHDTALAKLVDRYLYRTIPYIKKIDPEDLVEEMEDYDDLWDTDNGVVLCDFCHSLEHPAKDIW
jgi:5-methylcytosine-specific restriction endonuclease McrA